MNARNQICISLEFDLIWFCGKNKFLTNVKKNVYFSASQKQTIKYFKM